VCSSDLCPAFLACYLSPRISRLRATTACFNEYELQSVDKHFTFPRVISCLCGGIASFETCDIAFLVSLGEELENPDFLSLIPSQLTVSTAIQRFIGPKTRGQNGSREREFIASNLTDFLSQELTELDVEALLFILSNPYLKIQTEDTLVALIVELCEFDPGYFRLFSCVRFDYLSELGMNAFLTVRAEHADYMDAVIWDRLARRLRRPLPGVFYPIQCEFRERKTRPLEGLLHHLSKACRGNVHRQGVVAVSASGVWNDEYRFLPEHAADPTTDATFQSKREKPSWLCYDFKDGRVRITHYSIRSQPEGAAGFCNLKSWRVEGSNDEKNWVSLDERKDNKVLNAKNAIHTFSVEKKELCRYLRLVQTGPSWAQNDVIWIAAFELFREYFPTLDTART
jgi:hypothetical protein